MTYYLCRLCCSWTETGLLCERTTTYAIVARVFGIELAQLSSLPEYCCKQCASSLDACRVFYERVQASDAFIRNLHENDKLEAFLSRQDSWCPETGFSTTISEIRQAESVPWQDGVEGDCLGNVTPMKEKLISLDIMPVEELEIVNGPLIDAMHGEDSETLFKEEVLTAVQDLSGSGDECEPIDVNDLGPAKPSYRARHADQELIKKNPLMCYICEEEQTSVPSLRTHLFSHDDLLPYHCTQCSTPEQPIDIRTLIALNNHFESHQLPIQCEQCPLRFRTYDARVFHQKNKHNSKAPFVCDTCKKEFVNHYKFRKHMIAHRNKLTQRYKCGTCEKVFQNSTVLHRHELIHSDTKLFKCPFCARLFNHQSNFEVHKARHQRNQLKLYPCDVCDERYTKFDEWKRHMHQHFPQDRRYWSKELALSKELQDQAYYPASCQEPGCSYVAATIVKMWSHYQSHYKSFGCTQCGQNFAKMHKLRTHIETVHEQIRKHECTICGRLFAVAQKLREHLDWHNGIRSKQCKYCPKTFIFSSNLVIHERTHTGHKPHGCDQCDARFSSSAGLAKHKKCHDPKDPPKQKLIEQGHSGHV
ncbi:oocyte zinc finger protein XlCOF28-like [Anopheles aquasalis]|uniref:oocyte zinc finger protein XlCOF28-like n=1 Tax=Anopheles aquasalis TaxID=42839 RepID=UPI00215A2CCD|nr:oocyte zinc finger protein XlCOF28-like [Anopheles aquasalis]